jgi:hypothetical protein
VTIPTNPSGTYIFPQGPEWRSYPYAGHPYVGMKPPPSLFSESSSTGEAAEPLFKVRDEPFQSTLGEKSEGIPRWLVVVVLGLAWLLIFG